MFEQERDPADHAGWKATLAQLAMRRRRVTLMQALKSLSVLTGLGCTLALAGQAQAVYLGMNVEKYAVVNIGGINHDVWRVYVNFSNPGDQLISVGGSPDLGPLTVQSRNALDNGAGSAFYNHALGLDRPPTQADINANPNLAWDSFYSIGLTVADQGPFGDLMTIVAGTPSLTGTTVNIANGGWFATPTINVPPIIDNPQTLAGFAGDGDLATRVLSMQLTTVAGGNVRGTVVLSWREAGNPNGITVGGQTFNSFPAPGALALLGLAGMFGSRRRRV
jgi:hypothetical protein